METTPQGEHIEYLQFGEREIILVGTAHVSQESVEDVERIIVEKEPDRVCVEIDASRYKSLTEGQNWKNLNIYQVLRERKGFLLLANLVLSAFQKRIGAELGVKPGEEMKRAVQVAEEHEIPTSLCDREIQITLRRAWQKANFWNKNKMLAALFGSVFSSQKISAEEIEELKKKNALEDMLEELASYLPSVKEVLIDERDRYLATKIYKSSGNRIVAVVGAGHMNGIIAWLNALDKGDVDDDVTEIEEVPPRPKFVKVLPWLIPAAVAALFIVGFFRAGWEEAFSMLWAWILVNGSFSCIGAILALAHPLTIVISFAAAPITSLNPTIGVGIVTGLLEAVLRKPRVADFENLHEDIQSFRGFYRNRFTHILIVFLFSTIGSAIGTFIGIPYLSSLLM
jgi:pheromone shutdown-related protein TraB